MACSTQLPRALLILLIPQLLVGQSQSNGNGTHVVSRDSVTVIAGKNYEAGFFTRLFLGSTYRDLWTTPIRVPVLDLNAFAGGLKPLKRGGGLQTVSLRFANPEGREFVFRLVDKSRTAVPPQFAGSFVERIFRDQVSALHPAGGMVSAGILASAGVAHPTPVFAFMPDDERLGEFRAEFANRLGMIEEYPNVPNEVAGFAGALAIIDSDSLLKLLNSDPAHLIDRRAMLKARLVDFVLNDNDRHASQWKWASMNGAKPVRWVPIPRDRDHALINLNGALVRLARTVARPVLIPLEGSHIDLEGLTDDWSFDARMLAELDRKAWDSVASEVVASISDSVISAAVLLQPVEYQKRGAWLGSRLRERRNNLTRAAAEWYEWMNIRPEIHGTDAADRAVVTRLDDGLVNVTLLAEDSSRYFERDTGFDRD